MANLQNSYPDDQPQPQTDAGASSTRPMSPAQHRHFQELVRHTIDNAERVGHGHIMGSQGPKGHTLPKNDSHLQRGAYLPQNVQSTWSDGAADDGVVDDRG